MNDSQEDSQRSRQPRTYLAALTIFGLCLMFFGLGNDFNTPLLGVDDFQLDDVDVETAADEGNNLWRLAFVGIGAIGGCLLICPGGRKLHIGSMLSLAIMAAAAWAMMSVVWSVDPGVTARRIAGMLCVFVGTLGFAKHFSAKHLCLLALGYGLITLTASMAAELYHGTFELFDGDYRFAGTAHPNQQAIRMAVLLLGTISLARYNAQWRPLLIPLAIVALTALVLTKSRTSLVSVIAGLIALWLLEASPKFKLVSGLSVAAILCAVTVGILGAGISVDVGKVMMLGRSNMENDPQSFSGRVPVWQYAIEHLAERPWCGYGFNSFWSSDQLSDAHDELGWALPDAHNAYLDTALSIGLIGLCLVLIVVALGAYRAARMETRLHDPYSSFIVGLCVFGAVNGFFESHMLQPFNFTPFLVAAAFNRLAFFDVPGAVGDTQAQWLDYDDEDMAWEAPV